MERYLFIPHFVKPKYKIHIRPLSWKIINKTSSTLFPLQFLERMFHTNQANIKQVSPRAEELAPTHRSSAVVTVVIVVAPPPPISRCRFSLYFDFEQPIFIILMRRAQKHSPNDETMGEKEWNELASPSPLQTFFAHGMWNLQVLNVNHLQFPTFISDYIFYCMHIYKIQVLKLLDFVTIIQIYRVMPD